MALTKVIPPLQGLFFQGEALGVSPVERCTDCKLRISQCRICSSETAILTAAEEEEYNVLNLDVEEVKEDSIKLLKDVYVDDGTTRGTRDKLTEC